MNVHLSYSFVTGWTEKYWARFGVNKGVKGIKVDHIFFSGTLYWCRTSPLPQPPLTSGLVYTFHVKGEVGFWEPLNVCLCYVIQGCWHCRNAQVYILRPSRITKNRHFVQIQIILGFFINLEIVPGALLIQGVYVKSRDYVTRNQGHLVILV